MAHPRINMLGKTFGSFVVVKLGPLIGTKLHWIIRCIKCGDEMSMAGIDLRRRFKGIRCKGCIKIRTTRTHKTCHGCKKLLSINKFHHDANHLDGHTSYCKACVKQNKLVIYEMLNGARKRSKRKRIGFDLTIEFIRELNKKQDGRCIYTGLKLDWTYDYIRNPNRASLDRIDSSKGYTKDNVQLVTYATNLAKNSFSELEFLENCRLIVEQAKVRRLGFQGLTLTSISFYSGLCFSLS